MTAQLMMLGDIILQHTAASNASSVQEHQTAEGGNLRYSSAINQNKNFLKASYPDQTDMHIKPKCKTTKMLLNNSLLGQFYC